MGNVEEQTTRKKKETTPPVIPSSSPDEVAKPARGHQDVICMQMCRRKLPRSRNVRPAGRCPAPKSSKINDLVESGPCPAEGAPKAKISAAAPQL